MTSTRRGAAAVIIGNEVLSAKVQDANGGLLARRLRDRGVELRSLVVIPDEVDAIVEAVQSARRKSLHIFTSGGIGPTHDDVTVRSVALALGRNVVRSPELVKLVEQYAGNKITPESYRLAEMPEGASLMWHTGAGFPILCCEGIYMLPGVPQLFRIQLEAVLATLPGEPIHLKTLFLTSSEGEIAKVLDEVALESPSVAIGSYPNFDRALDYRVKVTVEHRESETVERIVSQLLQGLPREGVLRVE